MLRCKSGRQRADACNKVIAVLVRRSRVRAGRQMDWRWFLVEMRIRCASGREIRGNRFLPMLAMLLHCRSRRKTLMILRWCGNGYTQAGQLLPLPGRQMGIGLPPATTTTRFMSGARIKSFDQTCPNRECSPTGGGAGGYIHRSDVIETDLILQLNPGCALLRAFHGFRDKFHAAQAIMDGGIATLSWLPAFDATDIRNG